MAIAALVEIDGGPGGEGDLLEMPWPRPVLRVVPAGTDRRGAGETQADPVGDEPASAVLGVRRGPDVTVRRAARARVQRRRRRLVLGVAAAGLCAGLALPLSVLGGATPQAVGVPGTTLTGSTVYVVQAGDTVWSIASRFDRGGDPRPLAEAIAKETGSATVVPGERIAIP